jgi:hypothetical protein
MLDLLLKTNFGEENKNQRRLPLMPNQKLYKNVELEKISSVVQ